MSKSKVKVSVLTPVYDEPFEYLKRNIISVGQESIHTVEHVIILDNPSKQAEYYKLIKSLPVGAGETQIVMHGKNLGLPGARNLGLKKATGDYIMLLDCDDSFADHRIDKQIRFMQKHELDHSYGGYREIHGVNGVLKGLDIIPPPYPAGFLFSGQNVCYCGSNCFTRKVFDKLGGFDENLNGLGAEDLEYWIRLVNAGFKSQGMEEVIYYLGVTDNNMTAKYLAGGQFTKAYQYIASKHSNFIQS